MVVIWLAYYVPFKGLAKPQTQYNRFLTQQNHKDQIMLIELIHAIPFPDWLSDTALKLGPISIKWYGLGYVIGLILAFLYAVRTCEKLPIWQPRRPVTASAPIPSRKMLEDYMFFCMLGIIIGGRLGSVLLYNPSQYLENPLDIFKVWQGGMAFHGGFLGVVLATLYLARSRKLPIYRLADLAAISAPIGIFLVRMANFANQELYGRVTDVPWAFRFDTDMAGLPRHPSQLYEAFLEGFMIFAVLWLLTRQFKALTRPWLCTGGFIFMYGLFRIYVEFFREPDASRILGLTRGMAYSLPMLVVGLAIIIWALRRPAIAREQPDMANNDDA